jgi:hypothetical protein
MTSAFLRLESAPALAIFSHMLLCIDFQPAYEEAFVHLLDPLKERLREAVCSGEEVHFIYNDVLSLEGEELGDPEERVLAWCEKERISAKNLRLIRKNFGWVSHLFRSGRERTVAIAILRRLMASGLEDSSRIPRPHLERIVASSHDDFEGFWDCSPEAWDEMLTGAIAMPFLFEGGMGSWLDSLKGSAPEITGGFRHRCLDEMCMMLEASGISYRCNESLIYGLPEEPVTPEAPSWRDCESVSPLLFPLEKFVSR